MTTWLVDSTLGFLDARGVSTKGPITVIADHWLDDHGLIPAEPPPLRTKALRMAQAIEAGGPLARSHTRETLIPCTKRPEGNACPGLMVVVKQRDDAILLFCPICPNDELLIHEWQHTLWADGPMEPTDLAAVAAEHGMSTLGPEPALGPEGRDDLLARALTGLGSRWTPAEVRRRMATASTPSQVVQSIVESLTTPPTRTALECLLPVLMELWNDMRAASVATPPRRSTEVGPNESCPCGSGKKYECCCMRRETTH